MRDTVHSYLLGHSYSGYVDFYKQLHQHMRIQVLCPYSYVRKCTEKMQLLEVFIIAVHLKQDHQGKCKCQETIFGGTQ